MEFKFFLKTIPVMMGYIPLGMAYGILFVTELPYLEWYHAILISLVVYAGSGQFLLVSLLSAASGYIEIAIATFLLNSRHIFYGISLIQELESLPFWRKHIVIFGLTDETYALIKDSDFTEEEKQRAYCWIALCDHSYWVLGSALGVFVGSQFDFAWYGIEFALNALFAVLTLSMFLKTHNKLPFYIALVVGFVGIFVFPSDKMLILSILVIMCILLLLRWKERVNR